LLSCCKACNYPPVVNIAAIHTYYIMINIILAEDHQLVRSGLLHIISREPEFKVTVEASDGQQVLDALESGVKADVLVTDISMPKINGLELAQVVRSRFPAVRVMLLTMQEEEKYIQKAFQAGVKSYLLKTADAGELIFAIKQVARNQSYLCSSVAESLIKRVSPGQSMTPEPAQNVEFSKREMEVLHLIAEGYTNEEAAEKLFTSRRTVEGHRQSMINKTGTRNTPALIRFAMRHGIIN
jgi:two-component system response regulator NreC